MERWLAHHLAELISEADRTTGPAKEAAERRAVDAILKIWMHRRALPEPVDPLGGYRNAIAVLGRLMPEADPWKHYQQHGPFDGLLREMFNAMSRVVLGGILLTATENFRPISEAESKALEEEESYLKKVIEEWIPFFTIAPPSPKFNIQIIESSLASDVEEPVIPSEVDSEKTPAQQGVLDNASIHVAIIENLELLGSELSKLVSRWKSTVSRELKSGEHENDDA